jgi:hypothetical protein
MKTSGPGLVIKYRPLLSLRDSYLPAGSFIRRVARTPHYDGVKSKPAVIAICGMGPITYTWWIRASRICEYCERQGHLPPATPAQ